MRGKPEDNCRLLRNKGGQIGLTVRKRGLEATALNGAVGCDIVLMATGLDLNTRVKGRW